MSDHRASLSGPRPGQWPPVATTLVLGGGGGGGWYKTAKNTTWEIWIDMGSCWPDNVASVVDACINIWSDLYAICWGRPFSQYRCEPRFAFQPARCPHNKRPTPDSAGHSYQCFARFVFPTKNKGKIETGVIHNKSYLNLWLGCNGKCDCTLWFGRLPSWEEE